MLSLSRWYMHNTETMPYDTAEADYAIPSIGGEVTKTLCHHSTPWSSATMGTR